MKGGKRIETDSMIVCAKETEKGDVFIEVVRKRGGFDAAHIIKLHDAGYMVAPGNTLDEAWEKMRKPW